MGMSLSLANAIQAIAVSWVSTKSAPFGTLIARKEYRRLDHAFFQALRQAVAVSIAGALTAWLGVTYLNLQHIRFAQRLLDPISIAMLMLTMITNVTIFAQAYYLRAHKQEVLFLNSIVGALTVTAFTLIFGRLFVQGDRGQLLYWQFPWPNVVDVPLQKYRRLWHTP